MNTNRGSYLLGTALGSALVLTLCVNAHAADIYQAPPEPAYEAPPPPPLDRGIYIKGYIGQANPNVGSIHERNLQTPTTFSVFDSEIKSSPLFGLGIGWQHSHWLRFDLTGEYRGDALFVAHDRYSDLSQRANWAATNEYTADIQSWLGLANAYIDMGNWCGFTPYVGAGIGFATLSVNGLKDVNVPTRSVPSTARTTPTPTSPGRCTPARATTSPRRSRWISPIATPSLATPRAARSRPIDRREPPTAACSSRTSPRTT